MEDAASVRYARSSGMPQIIHNEDGTKTFTINSSELTGLKTLLDEYVPGFKKVLQAIDSSEVRATLEFLRSVFA
jgi:hypothetical protein